MPFADGCERIRKKRRESCGKVRCIEGLSCGTTRVMVTQSRHASQIFKQLTPIFQTVNTDLLVSFRSIRISCLTIAILSRKISHVPQLGNIDESNGQWSEYQQSVLRKNTGRIVSLDQFRGYTVLGMMLVNYFGGYAVCPQISSIRMTIAVMPTPSCRTFCSQWALPCDLPLEGGCKRWGVALPT